MSDLRVNPYQLQRFTGRDFHLKNRILLLQETKVPQILFSIKLSTLSVCSNWVLVHMFIVFLSGMYVKTKTTSRFTIKVLILLL